MQILIDGIIDNSMHNIGQRLVNIYVYVYASIS